MELTKAREMKETPATAANTQWLLWVDDEIWGYASTLADAKNLLNIISSSIAEELKKEQPQWTIECVSIDDMCKVKCLHPGYVYNSQWSAHTVRYEAVYKLRVDPQVEPQVDNTEELQPCRRAPSFDTIQTVDKFTNPVTRPPTPPSPPPMPSPPTLGRHRKKRTKRTRSENF